MTFLVRSLTQRVLGQAGSVKLKESKGETIMAQQKVVVVGGGLAGLSASMMLAELGVAVDMISLVPVKRSHSVSAHGGINS